jgi:hypothetical protein
MPEKMAPQETGRRNDIRRNHNESRMKWRRLLEVLAAGESLTRFDAERHGDHAFNTTVSLIGRKGIAVSREPIVLQGRYGEIRCKRYWLDPEQRKVALRLLGSV